MKKTLMSIKQEQQLIKQDIEALANKEGIHLTAEQIQLIAQSRGTALARKYYTNYMLSLIDDVVQEGALLE